MAILHDYRKLNTRLAHLRQGLVDRGLRVEDKNVTCKLVVGPCIRLQQGIAKVHHQGLGIIAEHKDA